MLTMRRFGLIVILGSILIAATATQPVAQSGPPDSAGSPNWWPGAEVERALSYLRLTPADLALRADYVDYDSCRHPFVDLAMTQPWRMPQLMRKIADTIFHDDTVIRPAQEWRANSIAAVAAARHLGLYQATSLHLLSPEVAPPGSAESRLGNFPEDWRRFIHEAEWVIAQGGLAAKVLRNLNREEQEFVLFTAPQFVLEDVADKDKSAEVLDSLQNLEDEWAVRFAQIATRLDLEPIWLVAQSDLLRLLELLPVSDHDAWPARKPRRLDVGCGTVIVGTPGDDQYAGNAAMILDPGGNDTYQLDPLGDGKNRLILDLDGNDRYFAPDGHDLGSARFGWSLLIDVKGDDLYQGGSFTMGSGWFGVGVLIDGAGNDIYSGDTFTQGAGAFGVGLLYDADGSDQYTGRLFSQGMGFAAGTGMLADAGGNDTYFAGGKYEDVLRYRDHYLSLSQGFGYGIRPHFSGGVGLLLDRDGNDLYVADIFAQGCSYWWSFGGLFDGGGNDQYVAFQYAQGSATHMTAGCLYDVSGDDRYESKGVSQGCGHDWAAGLLIDRAGNDRYIATDLSQAAGSANGVGVLIDGAGDDGYYVTSPGNTQGYGNPRREYGSIGLFLDLGGRDRYDGLGRDSTTWISSSKWGIGVDADSSWLAPPQEPSQ